MPPSHNWDPADGSHLRSEWLQPDVLHSLTRLRALRIEVRNRRSPGHIAGRCLPLPSRDESPICFGHLAVEKFAIGKAPIIHHSQAARPLGECSGRRKDRNPRGRSGDRSSGSCKGPSQAARFIRIVLVWFAAADSGGSYRRRGETEEGWRACIFPGVFCDGTSVGRSTLL